MVINSTYLKTSYSFCYFHILVQHVLNTNESIPVDDEKVSNYDYHIQQNCAWYVIRFWQQKIRTQFDILFSWTRIIDFEYKQK